MPLDNPTTGNPLLLDPITANDAPVATTTPRPARDTWPFSCLGHDRGTYFFQTHSHQIISKSGSSGWSPSFFLQLADRSWWQDRAESEDGKLDWVRATDILMSHCHAAGIYAPDRERAAGAHATNIGDIWHSGDRVHLFQVDEDPQVLELSDDRLRTEGYWTRTAVSAPLGAPLLLDQVRPVIEHFQRYPFASQTDRILSLGAIALAPVGSALPRRAHLWVTGPGGSGKTTLMQQAIRPMLEGSALFASGGTTEPGLRQSLDRRPVPVILDEAEGRDERRRQGLDRIITEAARPSYSSDGTDAAPRGSSSGKAVQYRWQSPFILLSVAPHIREEPDLGRWIVTRLVRTAQGVAAQTALKRESQSLFTAEFRSGFRARLMSLLPKIREANFTFQTALAEDQGVTSDRWAETLSYALSGYWFLKSDEAPTESEAADLVKSLDLSEHEGPTVSTDGNRALRTIKTLKIDAQSSTGQIWKTDVLDLMTRAYQGSDGGLDQKDSAKALAEIGIKLKDRLVLIHPNSDRLRQALKDTPYVSYAGYIAGETDLPRKQTWFRAGDQQRAIVFNLSDWLDLNGSVTP